jgi:hypothetical protein
VEKKIEKPTAVENNIKKENVVIDDASVQQKKTEEQTNSSKKQGGSSKKVDSNRSGIISTDRELPFLNMLVNHVNTDDLSSDVIASLGELVKNPPEKATMADCDAIKELIDKIRTTLPFTGLFKSYQDHVFRLPEEVMMSESVKQQVISVLNEARLRFENNSTQNEVRFRKTKEASEAVVRSVSNLHGTEKNICEISQNVGKALLEHAQMKHVKTVFGFINEIVDSTRTGSFPGIEKMISVPAQRETIPLWTAEFFMSLYVDYEDKRSSEFKECCMRSRCQRNKPVEGMIHTEPASHRATAYVAMWRPGENSSETKIPFCIQCYLCGLLSGILDGYIHDDSIVTTQMFRLDVNERNAIPLEYMIRRSNNNPKLNTLVDYVPDPELIAKNLIPVERLSKSIEQRYRLNSPSMSAATNLISRAPGDYLLEKGFFQ